MKSIALFALSILFIAPAIAQDLPKDEEGIITYTEVVEVAGMSQEALVKNAQKWFNEVYKSDQKRVTEGSKISDNHNIIVKKGSKDVGGVNYDVSIMVKDGRYKFVFTNFVHKDYQKTIGTGGKLEREEPKDGFSAKVWADIKVQVDTQIQELIAELKKAMVAKDAAKKDDW